MTPGPATVRATIPLTKYIPVPTQLPTPSEVKSSVVRHFWKDMEWPGQLYKSVLCMHYV